MSCPFKTSLSTYILSKGKKRKGLYPWGYGKITTIIQLFPAPHFSRADHHQKSPGDSQLYHYYPYFPLHCLQLNCQMALSAHTVAINHVLANQCLVATFCFFFSFFFFFFLFWLRGSFSAMRRHTLTLCSGITTGRTHGIESVSGVGQGKGPYLLFSLWSNFQILTKAPVVAVHGKSGSRSQGDRGTWNYACHLLISLTQSTSTRRLLAVRYEYRLLT